MFGFFVAMIDLFLDKLIYKAAVGGLGRDMHE
jgi:hypothetical protein